MLERKIICETCGESHPPGWPHTCSESTLNDLMTCQCVARYSIEPHGDGYAIYWGRCKHRHGANIARLTECGRDDIIKFFEAQLNRAT